MWSYACDIHNICTFLIVGIYLSTNPSARAEWETRSILSELMRFKDLASFISAVSLVVVEGTTFQKAKS